MKTFSISTALCLTAASFTCAAALLTASPAPEPAARQADAAGIVQLFNGRNLDGWDTDLGPVEKGAAPLGRNNDPKKVFSVVQEDGQPAIRVSGQVWGG